MHLDKPAGSACAKCPARDAAWLPSLPAKRPDGRTRLVVVGEHPSREDFNNDEVFTSRGARLLDSGLRTIGLSRGDVHYTNAVLCDCRKDDLPIASRQCRKRLHEEISSLGAATITTVGALALKAVLRPRSARILDWRGSITVLQWKRDAANKLQAFDVTIEASVGVLPPNAAYVLPLLHPFFVQRAPEWAPILEIDVARLGRVIHDGWQAPEHRHKLITVGDDISAIEELTGVEVAADVETPMSVNAMSAPLSCFVLADRKTSVVIPWARDMKATIPWWQSPGDVAKRVTTFLRGKTVVGHNLSFDIPVLARHGVVFQSLEDTLLGQHVLGSHFPKNLRHVASLYLDVAQWKLFPNHDSVSALHDYNARDGVYSILSWHAMKEELFQ